MDAKPSTLRQNSRPPPHQREIHKLAYLFYGVLSISAARRPAEVLDGIVELPVSIKRVAYPCPDFSNEPVDLLAR